MFLFLANIVFIVSQQFEVGAFQRSYFGMLRFFIMECFMSKEFGLHLRELRKAKGYTQQQMADLLNISRSTYTYYETGKSEPGYDKLKILCRVFDIDYNSIFNYDE